LNGRKFEMFGAIGAFKSSSSGLAHTNAYL
jgi:hypothetical protein